MNLKWLVYIYSVLAIILLVAGLGGRYGVNGSPEEDNTWVSIFYGVTDS